MKGTRWLLLAVLAAGGALTAAALSGGHGEKVLDGAGAEQEETLAPRSSPRDFLRLSEGSESTIFISEQQLQSVPLEELPLRATDRGILRGIRRDVLSGRRPSCLPSREVAERGSIEPVQDLSEMIAMSESSFLGQVLSIEEGWSPWLVDVARLAWVRVDSIVHDGAAEGLAPGMTAALLFRGGAIQFQGAAICEKPPVGFYRPEIGDTFLAAGTLGWDHRFFDASVVFKVEDGMVIPEPYGKLDRFAVPRTIGLVQQELEEEELREAESRQ